MQSYASTERVIEAIATKEGVSPVELSPPLYEAIDPDALEACLQTSPSNTGEVSVTFTYNGYHVTATSTGDVTVERDDAVEVSGAEKNEKTI